VVRAVGQAQPEPKTRGELNKHSGLSRVPGLLLLITGLWAALLLGASVLWPMGIGYDEPAHVEMVYEYLVHPFHFYGPGKLPSTVATERMFPPFGHLATAPIPPRRERPTLSQLGEGRFVPGSDPDQMVQHPPLYYELAALVLRLPGISGLAWDLQVWLLRLLSVVLLLPVPLLCWATTRRLTGRWAGVLPDRHGPLYDLGLVAAVVPLTIPNLVRDGSSVTNDALLIAATSILLYLLSRVVTGDRSYKTAAWISLTVAIAVLTKGFGLVLPPVIVAAYVFGSRTNGGHSWVRGFWKPLGVAAIGMVVGGLWWLRNLVEYGAVQVNGYGSSTVIYGKPQNNGTLLRFLPRFISDFTMRIWGGVGIPDAPSPGPFIIYGWLVLVVIGLAGGLILRQGRHGRGRSLLLLMPTVLTLLVVAAGSYSTFKGWPATGTHGTQGRYLYQTVPAVAAVATVGWAQFMRPRHRAVMLPFLTVAAVLTNAAVWILILRDWYQPPTGLPILTGLRAALHALLRWSPLPSPATILLAGALPVILSLTTVGVVLSATVRHHRLRNGGGGSPAADELVVSRPKVSPVSTVVVGSD
jgi:4-amino-4-deoxy-L-arabinose transferase-like glycosyltransferase